MKKTVYLSILLGTSVLATLGRVYSTFLAKWKDLSNHLTGDAELDTLMLEVASVTKKQYSFATSHLSKALVITMVATLLISLFYLIRKDKKAIYVYLGYLALTLVKSIYHFIVSDSVAKLYSDQEMRSIVQAEAKFSLASTVILLIVYLIIIFVNNRRGSSLALKSSSGIDL
ncbi:hypothetical protein [Streptococcus ovuberis]|uniref:Major facilitator superfamily permease n=1 Tax=Streptococcus ovuberis TaxID=1936207 RepID=A0A7X6N1B4_9STRE|nr:hypothetical protein [Streptococcus ovuberis]NKZ21221.1 hypothetical protein [Streptococcus ovuberis]